MVATISTWTVDASRILSQDEIDRTWAALTTKMSDSKTAIANRVIFALATYCGLRVSEIIAITLDDAALDRAEPAIYIRAAIAKGHKARIVPIWSVKALHALREWKGMRRTMGAVGSDTLVCSLATDALGKSLDRQNCRMRFKTACSCLGEDRTAHLTIHDGRHTMASMSLAKGAPIVAVKNSLGHSSISITNIYAHMWEKKQINID
jgi:site-specific recombinase XerD